MKMLQGLPILGVMLFGILASTQALIIIDTVNDIAGKLYMTTLNKLTETLLHKYVLATWNYETNLTSYNEKIQKQAAQAIVDAKRNLYNDLKTFNWTSYKDEDLKRMFKLYYKSIGAAALSPARYQEFVAAKNNMKSIYDEATICDYNDQTKCDLHEKDVEDIFKNSRLPDQLNDTWIQWHDAFGAASRDNFTEYVKISNEAAKLTGYNTTAERWLDRFENATIEDQLAESWITIQPLYKQLHAYVRKSLRDKYGENVVSARGPIPAHLLGNIDAQTWEIIESLSLPFPSAGKYNVTSEMISQNYTALKIFKVAEDFYKSMNFSALPAEFWANSIFEKPTDGRNFSCTPGAYNFFDGDDFRVKQCTNITQDDLINAHRLVTKVENFVEYNDQPVIYRGEAYPGSSDAIAEVAALSASSPTHLRTIQLLSDNIANGIEVASLVEDANNTEVANDTEVDDRLINQLYEAALTKIAPLPYDLIADLFRYGVYRGSTTPDNYNCHYWQMREELQGVAPAARRTESNFDAGANARVTADVPAVRYYATDVNGFSFYRSFCTVAGRYTRRSAGRGDLLVNCDLYLSMPAGTSIQDFLKKGRSMAGLAAAQSVTGEQAFDGTATLDYFQPLYDWLKKKNEESGEYIGWESSTVEHCTAAQKEEMRTSQFRRNLQKYRGN